MLSCVECRAKTSLLNNLVFVLKQQDLTLPDALPERTARLAFQKSRPWDDLLLSWLRPAPAWYAVALLLIVFSLLWNIPSLRQTSLYSEYEALMMESEPSNLGENVLQLYASEDVTDRLERGGDSQ
jgi:hypothetical protein